MQVAVLKKRGIKRSLCCIFCKEFFTRFIYNAVKSLKSLIIWLEFSKNVKKCSYICWLYWCTIWSKDLKFYILCLKFSKNVKKLRNCRFFWKNTKTIELFLKLIIVSFYHSLIYLSNCSILYKLIYFFIHSSVTYLKVFTFSHLLSWFIIHYLAYQIFHYFFNNSFIHSLFILLFIKIFTFSSRIA